MWRFQEVVLLGISATALLPLATATAPFVWTDVKPTTDLRYHDCYGGGFQCARLQLPLDWKNKSDTRTVAIAMIKLPAKVPDDDPKFGGSVFTNPGGPGGSGVAFGLLGGEYLQNYVDTPDKAYHEIISFDPRGIFMSTPIADCFPDSILAREAFMFESRGNGGLDGSSATLAYNRAMMDAMGKRCESADGGGLNGGEIFRYMGTPSVARDMVAMVDAIDELRKKDAKEKQPDEEEERLELKKRSGGDDDDEDVPRLKYIGFSYGTILGNYFASLFPERIDRLVLDGVCNTDDYAKGPGWLTNTVDADEIFDHFFDGCFEAEEGECALVRDEDVSASDIRKRVLAWLKSLDEAPMAEVGLSGTSVIVTGDDVRLLFGMGLYSPIAAFRAIAAIVDQAMRGNMDQLVSTIEFAGLRLEDGCPVGNATTMPHFAGRDPQFGVLCGDGEDITDRDLGWWRKYINRQMENSSIFGSFWSGIRFACSSWPFRANWIFKGPFTTPEASKPGKKPVKGRPAAPLLFVSNRLDPVTPLRAARAMAANHPGARVVVQEAMGHCATFAAYSSCTKKIIAEYLHKGVVPEGEAVCDASCGPWDKSCVPAMALTSEHIPETPWHARKFPLGVVA